MYKSTTAHVFVCEQYRLIFSASQSYVYTVRVKEKAKLRRGVKDDRSLFFLTREHGKFSSLDL